MFKHWVFIGVLSIALLTGCFGEPKLDTSNDKAYKESLEKIYTSIPDPEKATFLENLGIVIEGEAKVLISENRRPPSYDAMANLYNLIQTFGGSETDIIMQRIHGKTASDIIKNGQSILEKSLKSHLSVLNGKFSKQKEVTEDIVQQLQAKEEAETLINLKIGTIITTGKTVSDKEKYLEKVIIPVKIENKSNYKLKNIKNCKINVFHNNKEFGTAYLMDIRNKDNEAKPIRELNIAPKNAFEGQITLSCYGYTPYPLTEPMSAELVQKNIKFIFNDFEKFDTSSIDFMFGGVSYENEVQKLEKIKKEIEEINKELAKLVSL